MPISTRNRRTLICTVGTSLFNNIKNLRKEPKDLPENWALIDQSHANGRWSELARELGKLDPAENRLCGAEVNAIEQTLKRGRLPLERICFLVSDTEDGRDTGELLEHYYRRRKDTNLKDIESKVVEGLQDKEPKRFKTQGLRSLVRAIGDIVQRAGGPEYVAVDATGGYKAQIAVAVLTGQVLDMPVFYKYDGFSEFIDFPPLPVSFDYDLLGRYAGVLSLFESGKAMAEKELPKIDDKLLSLLVEVEVDGDKLYELGPMGQIYLTGYRLRNPISVKDLEPAEHRKKPSIPNHSWPKGTEEYALKLWSKYLWIRHIVGVDYGKQSEIRSKGIGFYIQNIGEERRLIGTYMDGSGFGARLRIFPSDESSAALTRAAEFLNRDFGT